MIVRPPAAKKPRRPRGERSASRRTPILWALVGLALLAAVVAGLLLTRDGDDKAAGDRPGPGGTPVALAGLTAHDPPPGDGEEHSDEASLATDGDPATYWRTESYDASLSMLKPGVGLVLDTEGSTVSELTVTTDTPGFTAEIRAGSSPESLGTTVSGAQTVESETTFELEQTDARYLLVWITELESGSAHINEVTAS